MEKFILQSYCNNANPPPSTTLVATTKPTICDAHNRKKIDTKSEIDARNTELRNCLLHLLFQTRLGEGITTVVPLIKWKTKTKMPCISKAIPRTLHVAQDLNNHQHGLIPELTKSIHLKTLIKKCKVGKCTNKYIFICNILQPLNVGRVTVEIICFVTV